MPRHHRPRTVERVELDIDALVAALDATTETDWQPGILKPLVCAGTIHRSAHPEGASVHPGNWIARTLDGTEELAEWLQENRRSLDMVISEGKLVVATFVRRGSYYTSEKDTTLLDNARLRRPRLMQPIEGERVDVKSLPLRRSQGRELALVFDTDTRQRLEDDALMLTETYGQPGKPQNLRVSIGAAATYEEAQEFIADSKDMIPAAVTLSESRVIEVR